MQRFGQGEFRFRRIIRVFCLMAVLACAAAPAVAHDAHYRWRNVRIEGGGYVSGLVCHPQAKGLCYARTDVGGAYRWDPAKRRWLPLTDWIAAGDQNLYGIDAVALDPSDPAWVYLVAGTYTTSRAGNAAILRSHDRGAYFQRVDLPFKMGGNELGRGDGDRLAVDPNDGHVLFLGTRNAGLWRSDDHGAHWSRVDGFPALATSPASTATNAWRTQPVGIVFVVFDPDSGRPGRPTPVIYAGVSTRKASLFRSIDGGRTWHAVSGQPVGLRPVHMRQAGDGSYYLVYDDGPGPGDAHAGAIWRWQPATGRWTNITPLTAKGRGESKGFGWGDVAVDPAHPAVLIASTLGCYTPHDLLFRSTDRGAHWREILARSVFEHADVPWTAAQTPHWMTSVVIDPSDPDHVMFVTGYGIWASRDMRKFDHGGTVHWWFQDRGLEETVPLGLISPPRGAHLLSAVGDLDGFRHDRLDVAPLQFAAPPRYANGESIDYAGRKPLLVVRSGYIREPYRPAVRAAWSDDGGRQWHAFAGEPPEGEGAGSIALLADGSGVLWAPRHAQHVYLTHDFGAHWQTAKGLPGGVRMACDRIDPRRCYAFDTHDGALFASHDGGATFTPIVGRLAAAVRGHRQVRLKASPVTAGVLYLAARDLPLIRGDDRGHVLETSSAVTGADAFGFGKPAAGRPQPTLFLAGRVDGHQGIYRSIDGGQHWRRINDDAHRYGRITHLTGDPRVFGRVYLATSGRGIVYGEPEAAKP